MKDFSQFRKSCDVRDTHDWKLPQNSCASRCTQLKPVPVPNNAVRNNAVPNRGLTSNISSNNAQQSSTDSTLSWLSHSKMAEPNRAVCVRPA